MANLAAPPCDYDIIKQYFLLLLTETGKNKENGVEEAELIVADDLGLEEYFGGLDENMPQTDVVLGIVVI